MLMEIINRLPDLLTMIPPLLKPLVQQAIQAKVNSVNPIQLENFDRDFERLLDAIAQRDHGMVAMLLERYHIPPNGIIERVIVRLMAGEKVR